MWTDLHHRLDAMLSRDASTREEWSSWRVLPVRCLVLTWLKCILMGRKMAHFPKRPKGWCTQTELNSSKIVAFLSRMEKFRINHRGKWKIWICNSRHSTISSVHTQGNSICIRVLHPKEKLPFDWKRKFYHQNWKGNYKHDSFWREHDTLRIYSRGS